MNTYQSFTRDDLLAMFDYDSDKGQFTRKSDGKKLSDFRYDCRTAQKGKVTLYLNRVALILMEDRFLEPTDIVRFKDGNKYNLTYDNLGVVKKSEDNKPTDAYKFVETATGGVFYNEATRMFVVRRGQNQAIYRTFDYKHAIAVRKEWETDNSIHKWDFTTPLWLKEVESAH